MLGADRLGTLGRSFSSGDFSRQTGRWMDGWVPNKEEVALSIGSFITRLRTCRQQKNLSQAQRLHACLCEQRLDTNGVLGNYLVPVLVECGSLLDAHHVFDRLPHPNQHSWTSLISGYIDYGDVDRAFCLYNDMQRFPIRPNSYTFVALLKASARLKDAERGQKLHSHVAAYALDTDLYIGNTLVDMYCKFGSIAEAQDVFHKLSIRDGVSWNALITGYVECGLGEKALSCLDHMLMDGVLPSDVTFICSLKACGILRTLDRGRLLVAQIARMGLERDVFICSSIVDMYAKCGSLADAQEVFDQLPVQNVVSWTALLAGYVECGFAKESLDRLKQMQLRGVFPDAFAYACGLKACGISSLLETGQRLHTEITKVGVEMEQYVGNTLVDMYAKCGSVVESQKVFDCLPVQDVVAWDALISGYAEHGLADDVLKCFEKMQATDLTLDTITFVRCLKACGTIGALETGRGIHTKIRKSELERDPFIANTLIDMYGKCGSLSEGREVFNNLQSQDVISWNALIKAYGENHAPEMAIQSFKNMQEQGVKPDDITFTCLLVACSHASLVLEGQDYFKLMNEKYEINPTSDHYACMVDLLARAGHVGEAGKFAEAMQCFSCKEVLNVLLTAAKNYGDMNWGLRCFQHLVQVNQEDASAYLLMEDIYADIGKWSDAKRVDDMRIYSLAKKKPGSASIEVEKEVHEFLVGEHSKVMSGLLEALSSCLKDDSYIPYIDLILKCKSDDTGITP